MRVPVNQRGVVVEAVEPPVAIHVGDPAALAGGGIRWIRGHVNGCSRVAAGHHVLSTSPERGGSRAGLEPSPGLAECARRSRSCRDGHWNVLRSPSIPLANVNGKRATIEIGR